VEAALARRTLLATGGLGYLYLHTTNPPSATGDGLAAAYRASARIVNCEYVQFHPTALYVPGKARTLLTEALRGEGARLITRKGERFMMKYEPEHLELAPRDVVSRAIFQEMAASGEACVYLDLAPVAARLDLDSHFPTVMAACRAEGMDPHRQPIPVVPAAHYFCGGVLVDLDGRPSLPGLFAAGPVALPGPHGPHRLDPPPPPAAPPWGFKGAEAAVRELEGADLPNPGELAQWRMPLAPQATDPLLIDQDWGLIRSTLWNYAGIVRTGARLERAKADLHYLAHRIERFYHEASLSRELLELRSGILCARLILNAALQNPESRGCHYRVD